MGLLSIGLFLQAIGSRDLRARLGGMFGSVFYIGFLAAAALAAYVIVGFNGVTYTAPIASYLSTLYFIAVVFVVIWQMISVFYVDSSQTWIGFLAGILNGLFIPTLALGIALGPIAIYAAYGLLLAGQLMSLLYWWSPKSTIRGFARSPSKAKFAFGLSGVLTFVIGAAAVFIGPLGTHYLGGSIWYPWSTTTAVEEGVSALHYLTNPALVYGFLAIMLCRSFVIE